MADVKKKRMGRPPRVEGGEYKDPVLTDSFRFMLTPHMKAWIREHGGGEYIRRLVDADRDNTNRIPTGVEIR